MIRDKEILCSRRRGLETLGAVPGHILNSNKRAVCEEEEIKEPVPDNGVVRSFYH